MTLKCELPFLPLNITGYTMRVTVRHNGNVECMELSNGRPIPKLNIVDIENQSRIELDIEFEIVRLYESRGWSPSQKGIDKSQWVNYGVI